MDLKGIDKQVGRIERTAAKAAQSAGPSVAGPRSADGVELSIEAQDVLSVFDAVRTLAAAPAAVREDRVQEARVRIADGFYERPEVHRAVATKLAFSFLGLAPRLV